MTEAEDGVPLGAPTPLFFVSVACKGVSSAVSLLFATLAGRFISVAAKGLTGADCWQESNWVGFEDFEGVRRTTWRAGPGIATGMQMTHMVRRALSFPTGPESAIPTRPGSMAPTRSGSTIAKGAAGRQKDRADYNKNYSVLVQSVKDYL